MSTLLTAVHLHRLRSSRQQEPHMQGPRPRSGRTAHTWPAGAIGRMSGAIPFSSSCVRPAMDDRHRRIKIIEEPAVVGPERRKAHDLEVEPARRDRAFCAKVRRPIQALCEPRSGQSPQSSTVPPLEGLVAADGSFRGRSGSGRSEFGWGRCHSPRRGGGQTRRLARAREQPDRCPAAGDDSGTETSPSRAGASATLHNAVTVRARSTSIAALPPHGRSDGAPSWEASAGPAVDRTLRSWRIGTSRRMEQVCAAPRAGSPAVGDQARSNPFPSPWRQYCSCCTSGSIATRWKPGSPSLLATTREQRSPSDLPCR